MAGESKNESKNVSKNDPAVPSCAGHKKEAAWKEYDLVIGNGSCGMGHIDGGVRQIVWNTKPCDDRLDRRDTGMCKCECWYTVGDTENTSCDV